MCGLNGESCYNISTDKIRISYINILFIYFLWNSFCNWFEKMKFGLILLFVFAIFQPALSQDNNPPSFTATGYIFTVSEDASVGTPLTGAPPVSCIKYFYYNHGLRSVRKCGDTSINNSRFI